MDKTGCETKKAWEDNWQGHTVEELLEIFKYPRVAKQLNLYLGLLPKNKPILEGGCGLGPYLIHLKSLGYDTVGVDYNREPLKKIKKYNDSLPVAVNDVRALSFKNNSFGAYLSLGVIEHFPEGPEEAIKEANRVLAEGAVFIVQVPVMNIFLTLKYPLELLRRNSILRKIFQKRKKNYYWQQYFRAKQLKSKIENKGFIVEKITPMDHEHSIISFSSIFRDKKSYDAANRLGLKFAVFCEKNFPWITAANMILICRKTSNR